MGIRKVLAPSAKKAGPVRAQDLLPDEPLTRQQAMQAMRRMTSQLDRINRAERARRSPTVPLNGRKTPKILATKDTSRPLAQEAVAGAAKFTLASTGAESLDMVRKPARKAKRETALRDKAPATKALSWKRDWTGSESVLDSPGGAVIKTPENWADLWGRMKREDPLPEVDFGEKMVVAVFGGRSQLGREVEIVSTSVQQGRLLILYRTTVREEAAGPSAPFHTVVVPRSDVPFTFIQVR